MPQDSEEPPICTSRMREKYPSPKKAQEEAC